MEQPTEQPPVKKTADINAYMRDYMKQYRQKNLEKCKAQERAKYHRRKPKTDEEKVLAAEKRVLNALAKYPEILKSI
ncbi:hypothetical protein EBV26_19195 [bacterium]|nr:hypothetical protein [bacterium]